MVSGRKLRAPNGAMLHRKRRSPCDKLNSAYTTLARLRSGKLYSKTRRINAKYILATARRMSKSVLREVMVDTVHGAAAPVTRVSDAYRWTQLAIGVAAMVMIANYQYGWTFFVPDIQKKFGWDRASIQWAFTLFVLFETWLVPIEGWFVDKYGPRLVVLLGGILCAIGWAINAEATSLNGYYFGMIIAGIGAGAVYGTCVGNALKWFPDKRGLAAGITAAGFGAGPALTVAPIQAMIKESGFQATFLYFGLGQGIIIVILAFFLFAPKSGQVPASIQSANI